jgi:hypothetical protein
MVTTLATMAAALLAPVPDAWVDAVEQVESSGRGALTPAGDGGHAIGPFQFWNGSWSDCSAVRRNLGLPVYPYTKAADPVIAREYARVWLAHTRRRLQDKVGRLPTLGETWLAWNLGITGYGRYNYNMQNVPDSKFMKAFRLNKTR